jgi:hypothetical protein
LLGRCTNFEKLKRGAEVGGASNLWSRINDLRNTSHIRDDRAQAERRALADYPMKTITYLVINL